jgi:hypothetical protein
MTSLDQPGQMSNDDHKREENRQRPAGRSSRARHQKRSRLPHYKSGRFWIGLSAIVLFGLAATLLYIGLGGSHNGAGTAKGQGVSAAKLAENGGALAVPESMRDSVINWQSGPGGQELTLLSKQLGQALQAATFSQNSQTEYLCTQLARSVATAKAGSPIPDAAMQQLYAKALGELTKGAADCRTAISVKANGKSTKAHVNTTMLHRATSELSTGATELYRATAEIEIISRQSG